MHFCISSINSPSREIAVKYNFALLLSTHFHQSSVQLFPCYQPLPLILIHKCKHEMTGKITHPNLIPNLTLKKDKSPTISDTPSPPFAKALH